MMKGKLWMLSAAVAVCVAHATALAQYPGAPQPWRPDMRFPPNWQPGPGGAPFGRRGPLGSQRPVGPPVPGPNIPGIGSGYFGGESGPGSSSPLPGITPPEPNVRDIINQMPNGNPAVPPPNPGASARIPPQVLEQLVIPPAQPDFPNFVPARFPEHAPVRHEPFAPLSWLRWEWVAGIFVLGLLACLLRGCFGRKQTGA